MAIFNADSQSRISAIDSFLNKRIKAPYVYSQVSTLGGVPHATALVKVSLDSKSKWHNGILQNSRYFMIRIDRNGEMEMFSKSYKLQSRMRGQTAKSLPDAVARINKYISSVR
jgi:hypothetical protein